MGTATESVKFFNIAANTAAFYLRGGKYVAIVVATFGGGSVTLQLTLRKVGSCVNQPCNRL